MAIGLLHSSLRRTMWLMVADHRWFAEHTFITNVLSELKSVSEGSHRIRAPMMGCLTRASHANISLTGALGPMPWQRFAYM